MRQAMDALFRYNESKGRAAPEVVERLRVWRLSRCLERCRSTSGDRWGVLSTRSTDQLLRAV